MSRKWMRLLGAAALVGALGLAAAGCTRVELGTSDEVTSNDVSVDLGGAEEADVRISMGAGELKVGAGARAGKLMSADFDFSPSSWEPVVEHETTDAQATLEVSQPRVSGLPIGRTANKWDVRLSDQVALKLDIGLGAGEGTLELSGLDLRELEVNVGAGDVTVDLTGDWDNDVRAYVRGGAGSFTVLVPADVGVRVTGVTGGVGSFEADGMRKEGDAYVNEAYGTAPVSIELEITRGVGEIRVDVVE